MPQLDDQQNQFLEQPYVGVATTLRADGTPHNTVVWVDVENGAVSFNTAVGRAKERHLRRDPRISVVVLPADDQQSGYVSVTGTAELSEDGAVDHIDKLAKKYIGADKYPYLQPGERRIIVKITPEKVDGFGI
jgi:PPOX class probable F420-dependent enzyme